MATLHDDQDLWASDLWRPSLEKYGGVTKLTVVLYDADGRLACGPINRTSLFELFGESEHDPGLFAECAARCRSSANGTVVAKRFGLAAVGTQLSVNGDRVGAAVAGYHLSEFPQPIAIERLARDTRLPQAQVWDAVRRETPASLARMTCDAELLQVLAETVLREHRRSREHIELSARLQAADASKDEFLAMVSHELRGPLNAILGWTRLLRTERLSDAARERALDTIERNAWMQTRLVEDLLDVSQIIAGRLEVDQRQLALAPIIDQAIATLSPSAQSKDVRLHVRLQDNALVAGDSLQLQRIAVNLIANAIKFTPPGGDVSVTLSHDDRSATLIVSDSGSGIKPEFLPHIFEPFRQQDASTTRVHGGVGLGLTIARHLVVLHGGSIGAESPGVDRGATFTVVLPLVIGATDVTHAPAVAAIARPVDDSPLPKFGRRVHVLVVDDDWDAREVLHAVLQQAGANVTVVASAKEALAVIDQRRPDVLVSDIGLPGEDGYALIRQVRARPAKDGEQMPAIAVTAYAGAADHERATSSGYNRHLSKPVDVRELILAIESLATPRL
jgi:signal transduction histidine kinase/CheY-like chemotaxis protein